MSRRHATERVLAAAALLDSSDQAPMFSYSVHLGSNQRLGAIRPHASWPTSNRLQNPRKRRPARAIRWEGHSALAGTV